MHFQNIIKRPAFTQYGARQFTISFWHFLSEKVWKGLVCESKDKTGQQKFLLLMVAVSPSKKVMDAGYDIPSIAGGLLLWPMITMDIGTRKLDMSVPCMLIQKIIIISILQV